jgi:hypothetical protein
MLGGIMSEKEIGIKSVEKIDFNLSRIIEGTEGKLKDIAVETKKEFSKLQDVLSNLEDSLDSMKEKLREVL